MELSEASQGAGGLVEDALREMENIGAGSVADRLSSIFCSRVSHDVPRTGIVPVEELGRVIAPPGEMGVCVFCPVALSRGESKTEGNIIMFLDQENANLLVRALGSEMEPHPLSKTDQSRLSEFARLVFTVFIDAIANFIGLETDKGAIRVAPLMGEGMIDLLTISSHDNKNMVIQTNMRIESFGCAFTLVLQVGATGIEGLLQGVV